MILNAAMNRNVTQFRVTQNTPVHG